jgi:hypothetical protein
MRSRRVVVGIVVVLAVAAVAAFFLVRRTVATVGPPIALCPGPDQYGYTCDTETAFAYVDAGTDTFLYEDDGLAVLELPFTFTFYGNSYTEVLASSNGNLQFTTENGTYENLCMTEAPVAEMGDMIAPYWDDLDLTAVGYLETEVVGESPERIFVIEWDDVPRYGTNDLVTFEVQLFEGSHDIVFLYESVTAFEGNSGSSATVGLQSEGQGLALQYGCAEAVLSNGRTVYFPHPVDLDEEETEEVAVVPARGMVLPPKGEVARLMAALERSGPGMVGVLPGLNQEWLGQNPARLGAWEWADVNGDGRDDLVILWRGEREHPEVAQLAILTVGSDGEVAVAYDQRLWTRLEGVERPALVAVVDLTADGRPDVLVHDEASGRLLVASEVGGEGWQMVDVPERCVGGVVVRDVDGDGRPEIVRDGCGGDGRVVTGWNGRGFVVR